MWSNELPEQGAPFVRLPPGRIQGTTSAHQFDGAYQKKNAALAIRATEILEQNFPVDSRKSAVALTEVRLKGGGRCFPESPRLFWMLAITRRRPKPFGVTSLNLRGAVEVWLGSLEELGQGRLSRQFFLLQSGFRFFQPSQPRACSSVCLLD